NNLERFAGDNVILAEINFTVDKTYILDQITFSFISPVEVAPDGFSPLGGIADLRTTPFKLAPLADTPSRSGTGGGVAPIHFAPLFLAPDLGTAGDVSRSVNRSCQYIIYVKIDHKPMSAAALHSAA